MRNLITVFIGISIIITCSFIAYFTQKHLFSKYKNKVKNIVTNSNKNN